MTDLRRGLPPYQPVGADDALWAGSDCVVNDQQMIGNRVINVTIAPRPICRRVRVGASLRVEDPIAQRLNGIDLVRIGGGYALRTKARYGAAIRAAFELDPESRGLSKLEAGVLAAIAYEQPITRAALSERFGREISRDLIASLRDRALIAPGPRAPQPGAPFAYVTTARFLAMFGLETLGELPDLEALQDAGLAEDAKPLGA